MNVVPDEGYYLMNVVFDEAYYMINVLIDEGCTLTFMRYNIHQV
jgi:hypothetical protein